MLNTEEYHIYILNAKMLNNSRITPVSPDSDIVFPDEVSHSKISPS